MAQNTNEWKFRTKRERQRVEPYSRPINDSRSGRLVNNLNPNNNSIDSNSNTISLLSRISTGFKDLLIPNWLRNTTNFINFNNNINDNNSNVINDKSSETLIQTESHINDKRTTNSWESSPRLTPFTNNWVPLKTPLNEVNPNDYLSKPSTSSTMFTTTDEIRQSTSFSNQNKPQVIDITEADDRSSSSSATASSTSGCSSLVPSHSDNVLRHGLPLETMRKELAKVKNRDSMSGSDSSLNKALIVGQKRVNVNNNFTNSSLYNSSNNNMKQFSVEKFMSPSSVLPQKSHFYAGKTIYGGANVSRAAQLAGTTPYNLSSRLSLAPVMKVQVNSSRRIDTNDQLSSSSKKIFEKLEKASTPIQDAKRVPLYGSHYKNYFQSTQHLLRSNKRPKMGPPIASILTPSKATIDDRNNPIIYQLTQVLDNDYEKKSANNKLTNNCDNYSIDLKRNEFNENKVSEGGGKILRKEAKKAKNDDLVDEENIESTLSSAMPLTIPSGISLPKFNFGNSSSFQKQSSADKTLPTTTLTKVEDKKVFEFSSPTLKKTEKKMEFSENESIGSTPFTFSSPKGEIQSNKLVISQTKNTENDSKESKQSLKTSEIRPQLSGETVVFPNAKIDEKSELNANKEKEDKWVCECLYYNYGEQKCRACSKERGSKSVEVPKSSLPLSSWGSKFKAPEGSWNCPICMINNTSDKTKCAACETPKPGLENTKTANESLNNWSDNWQCFYCKENNEISRKICISCEKMKTTKADVDVLYSGQTFKFGITQNKDKIFNKEDTKDNLKDDNNPIKANPMPLFSKSSDNSSQITVSDSTPFTFGSTLIAKPTTTSTAEPVFRFGLTTNKPIDVKPTESSMTTTTSSEALAPNKAINLFEFGAQTSSIITPITTVSSGFTFGIQNKPNKESETEKSVSFESQKNSKLSEPLEAENKPTSELNFQLKKPIEEKSQLFSFGPNTTTGFSSLNSSIFGSKTAASSGVVTTVSPSTTSLSNTFNQLPNITPNKSMNAFFGLPVTTTSSPSLLSSSLLINNNKLNTGLTSIQPIQTVTTTSSEETGKTLFSSNSSAIKPFDTLIANNTSQTPIVSTSTVTSTTSSQQNSLVFGNSNNNLQSLSSIASNVNTTKPNFSFNVNASAGHQDSSFAPNKLFAPNDSKAFAFGNAPLSSSQTGFSFTLPTTNATPLTSSTISFGLNSNNSNTNNNAKSSTDSLFTFGQNSEPFASSIAQKAPNSINSPQFNFGANQTTGQNTNIFGNAMNSSQSSLSFNPTSLTTNTNSTPFSFGFGATQSTPSVPQLQAQQQQQQQQQPLPPPQYNFSQQPTFDFARMNSTENQSSPLFQFSAEPTAGRSYKKAKRRLHPT